MLTYTQTHIKIGTEVENNFTKNYIEIRQVKRLFEKTSYQIEQREREGDSGTERERGGRGTERQGAMGQREGRRTDREKGGAVEQTERRREPSNRQREGGDCRTDRKKGKGAIEQSHGAPSNKEKGPLNPVGVQNIDIMTAEEST